MNTWKLRQLELGNMLRLFLLLSIAFSGQPQITVTAQDVGPSPSDNSFIIRNYGGKCLDFGPAPQVSGTPVFIFDCNGSNAQQVRIEEINAKHDVILRAGNKVIGVNADLVIGFPATTQATGYQEAQMPLELQDEKDRNTILSRGQIFALDGDSIILVMNRDLVVEVQHARSPNRTPLVLGNRNLNDAEFWTFTASDGSNLRPTRGFVRISQIDNFDDGGELRARTDFLNALQNAGWGTVIELDSNVDIKLTSVGLLHVPAGVTIRGDRRGTLPGPLLKALHDQGNLRSPYFPNSDVGMLIVNGDHVRITGLRMQGPGGDDEFPYANGIATQDQFSALIDHNEMFGWTAAAVYVNSEGIEDLSDPYFSRPQNLRVVRNFIHHNNSSGYGVATYGSYPYIEGNTFITNRHSIAASNEVDTAYRAWFNLALAAVPPTLTSDFDAHGTGSHGFGGTAGQYFEIARNTFLGTNRENFILRGTPAYPAEFRQNVSRLSPGDALTNWSTSAMLNVVGNQFSVSNPTNRLGVGDFDGDGTQDLFLATGVAWYYAPAGKTEWRYLNARIDTINTLLFGDFDADRRTDVFTQHNYSWDISWGGASRWENINVSWAILGDAAIGDFIGDERDDVFYSDGQTWHVSDGGVGQFTELNTSSYRVSSLRFGDFNADGKKDVFSVVSGQWKVSYSGTSSWQLLRPKLTDSVAGLIVADFNGDGRADIGTSTKILWPPWSYGDYEWKVSFSGKDDWTTLHKDDQALASAAAIGRFDSNASADVLLWHHNYLDIVSGGKGTSYRHSREDMR